MATPVEPVVSYRATETDILAPSRRWVARETVLALFSIGLLVVARLAISPNRMTWMKALPEEAWTTLVVAGAILTGRTVWRYVASLILHNGLYPVKGYSIGPPEAAWAQIGGDSSPSRSCWVQSFDGTMIHTQRLPAADGAADRPGSGKTIVICPGNAMLYDVNYLPEDFLALRRAGYSIQLFHPPGYGRSGGTRTVHSDCLALDAIVKWLKQPVSDGGYEVEEKDIHLSGQSIGSVAVTEAMTHYAFGHSVLIVPVGRFQTIVRRLIGPSSWFVNSVIREQIEPNNVGKMSRLQTRSLTIALASEDQLMGMRPLREGEALRNAWLGGGVVMMETDAVSADVQVDPVRRGRVTDNDRSLQFLTYEVDHNDIASFALWSDMFIEQGQSSVTQKLVATGLNTSRIRDRTQGRAVSVLRLSLRRSRGPASVQRT